MNDDQLDQLLRDAEHAYNPPPETPREQIWARLEGARRMRGGHWRRRAGRPVWLRWGAGVAAALVLGIGIGRLSAPLSEPQPTTARRVVDPVAERSTLPYRLAAVEYLSRAEALLTTYRTGPGARERTEVAGWARDLLTTTRLLLDSPAATDPQLRQLLEDLELVLAQVARISPDRASSETGFITQAIEEHNVLLRLRTAVPAGPARADT